MSNRPVRKPKTTDRNERVASYQDPPQNLKKHMFYGMKLDEDQQKFRDAIYDPNIDVVFCDSPAGTGKTTVAVATANIMVRQYGLYNGITYVISPCMESEIGFLPGTMEEKVKPYSTALEQALIECNEQPEKVIIQNGAASVKDGAYVDFIPHIFLRGANLSKAVVIIEEAQNYDFHSLKKVLTRVKDDCKLIVIGHDGQRDAYQGGQSAFSIYLEHFSECDRAAVVKLKQNYRGWIANHADALIAVYEDDIEDSKDVTYASAGEPDTRRVIGFGAANEWGLDK